MRSWTLVFLLMGLLALTQPVSLAWDGNWTDASSGRGALFDDPERSDTKAGTDPPQKFWIPDRRDYRDIDPEELSDYFNRRNKDYAPYALARVIQALHYGDLVIPKGYYLIKPGDETDGSPRVNLKTLSPSTTPAELDEAEAPASHLPPIQDESAQAPAQPLVMANAPVQKANPKRKRSEPLPYQTFVILKQGKVIGVVPIHHIQEYRPAGKEKLPRRALAWMEWEARRPMLKFYYHHWVYTSEFQ